VAYGKPGAKSDVFAFGATLYRLLSAESPRFPHPSELPDVPELQSLLLDCLKQNPDKRPDTQTVFRRLLDLKESAVQPSLALNCELKQRDSKTWHFSLAPKHKTLLRPERTKKIEELPAIAQQRIQEQA